MKKLDITWVVTLVCAFLYLLNIAFSTGIYDINDGLAHFAIARYAPKHPELFLDHWGKPLFTIVASPFAVFGIKGVMFMNALLYIITARLLVSMCKLYDFKFAWAAPLLLAFMPVYFQVVMSGLTEVLFAALTLGALFFFAKERYIYSALLITWLPFARSEAYFIVPLMAMALLFKKQWLPLVLLFVGPIIMSVLGFFVLDDLWWMINDNPYTGAKEIYGSGTFTHFIGNAKDITGLGVAASVTLAIVLLPTLGKKLFVPKTMAVYLAVGFLLAVVLGHSYFWWKGLYGSLGLLRVTATVAPMFVFLALFAVNKLASYMVKPQLLVVVILFFCIDTMAALERSQPILRKPDKQEELIKELGQWIEQSKYAGNPNVWYMHPAIGYYLSIDNFDDVNSSQLWYLDRVTPSNSIREGGLIVYDGGRAPNEGKTSKELLFADPHLKLVKTVKPPEKLMDMNNYEFELLVFEKQFSFKGDTIVHENFSAYRPIVEERLNRILTDSSTQKKYYQMLTFTQWTNVFTFWNPEKENWKSSYFDFWYDADQDLQVYLAYLKHDGSQDLIAIEQGVFKLPEMDDDIVKYSLAIYSADPEVPVRVNEWGLRQVAKPE